MKSVYQQGPDGTSLSDPELFLRRHLNLCPPCLHYPFPSPCGFLAHHEADLFQSCSHPKGMEVRAVVIGTEKTARDAESTWLRRWDGLMAGAALHWGRSRTGRTWPEAVGSAEDTGRSGHEKDSASWGQCPERLTRLLCDQAPEWTP